MSDSDEVAAAWAELHRYRHEHWPDDERSRRLAIWQSVVALREARDGEFEPSHWSSMMLSLIDAIASGRPFAPIYARMKRSPHLPPYLATGPFTIDEPEAAAGPDLRASFDALLEVMRAARQEMVEEVERGELRPEVLDDPRLWRW